MVQQTPRLPASRFQPEPILSQYVREVAGIRVLTDGEEHALLERAQQGDRKSLNALVRANLKFVVAVCHNYAGNGLPMSDLINEGNLGLIRAVERFDTTQPIRFISYAVWWIRQGILAAISRQQGFISIPPTWAAETRLIRRADQSLTQKLGRSPDLEELGESTGLTEDTLRLHGDVLQGAALPRKAGSEEGADPLESVASPEQDGGPDREAERFLVSKCIREGMHRLTPREQTILKMFFGFDCPRTYTLREIADHVGASRERIRQIKAAALEKLRKTPCFRKETDPELIAPRLREAA